MHVEQSPQQHQVYQHHPKPVVKHEVANNAEAAVLVEPVAAENVQVENVPEVINPSAQPVVFKINRNRAPRNNQ